VKILLVSATGFEVDPTFEALKSLGHEVEKFTVGIGALEAAKRAHALADVVKNQNVIFIGSCGHFTSFDDGQIKLTSAKTVHWLPTCERQSLSYSIKGSSPPVTMKTPPSWCSLKQSNVLCAPAISLTDTLPSKFTPSECVENVELYSVANELNSAKTLAVILAITNKVGLNSHEQWKSGFKLAAQETSDFIKRHLNEN